MSPGLTRATTAAALQRFVPLSHHSNDDPKSRIPRYRASAEILNKPREEKETTLRLQENDQNAWVIVLRGCAEHDHPRGSEKSTLDYKLSCVVLGVVHYSVLSAQKCGCGSQRDFGASVTSALQFTRWRRPSKRPRRNANIFILYNLTGRCLLGISHHQSVRTHEKNKNENKPRQAVNIETLLPSHDCYQYEDHREKRERLVAGTTAQRLRRNRAGQRSRPSDIFLAETSRTRPTRRASRSSDAVSRYIQ